MSDYNEDDHQVEEEEDNEYWKAELEKSILFPSFVFFFPFIILGNVVEVEKKANKHLN